MNRSKLSRWAGALACGGAILPAAVQADHCAAPVPTCSVPSYCYRTPDCAAPPLAPSAPQPPARDVVVPQTLMQPETVMVPMTVMVPQTVYRQRTIYQRMQAPPAALTAPVEAAPLAPAAPTCAGNSAATQAALIALLLKNNQPAATAAAAPARAPSRDLHDRVQRLENRLDRLIEIMEKKQ